MSAEAELDDALNGAPQFSQNASLGPVGWPHCGHVMSRPPL
jgi:hypothetical protein